MFLTNLCKYVALKCHWLMALMRAFMEFVLSLQFTVTIFFYNDNIIIKDEKCKQHVG